MREEPEETDPGLPRIVIVGGGFAGLSAARALRRVVARVTLIDRGNHHLFQPLLYQVATAALAPSDITAPIRWLLRKQRNTHVLLADVEAIDLDARRLDLKGATPVAYDYLILAAGARHSYFAHPEWERFAPGLKSVEDALVMRNRFLEAFELAERCDDPEERRALQTIVVIGGGPTGVELAGVMPSIMRNALAPDFRRIDIADSRVILIEAGPRILGVFPESLARAAHRDLARLGVDVRLGSPVTRVEADAVWIGDERIPARTIFWAAGNEASPLAKQLGVALTRSGHVPVEPDLSLPGRPEVFVVGDMAALEQGGRPVPWVAPAANQQGIHAARTILRSMEGRARKPFRYHDKGNLATIGRNKAIADFGFLRLSGFAAWWFWLFVHVLYLAGFRNRVSVLVQWAYAYFTYQRGVRLITRLRRDE